MIIKDPCISQKFEEWGLFEVDLAFVWWVVTVVYEQVLNSLFQLTNRIPLNWSWLNTRSLRTHRTLFLSSIPLCFWCHWFLFRILSRKRCSTFIQLVRGSTHSKMVTWGWKWFLDWGEHVEVVVMLLVIWGHIVLILQLLLLKNLCISITSQWWILFFTRLRWCLLLMIKVIIEIYGFVGIILLLGGTVVHVVVGGMRLLLLMVEVGFRGFH